MDVLMYLPVFGCAPPGKTAHIGAGANSICRHLKAPRAQIFSRILRVNTAICRFTEFITLVEDVTYAMRIGTGDCEGRTIQVNNVRVMRI